MGDIIVRRRGIRSRDRDGIQHKRVLQRQNRVGSLIAFPCFQKVKFVLL